MQVQVAVAGSRKDEGPKEDAQYRRSRLAELEGVTWAVDEETKKPLTGSAFLRWKANAPERDKEKAKADEKRTQEEQRAERAKEAADAAATRRAAAAPRSSMRMYGALSAVCVCT